MYGGIEKALPGAIIRFNLNLFAASECRSTYSAKYSFEATNVGAYYTAQSLENE